MAQVNVSPPSLPLAPEEYNRQYMDKLANVFRLFFNQINNAGPIAGATQRNGTDVISGLSFSQPDPATPGQYVVSLPTDADYATVQFRLNASKPKEDGAAYIIGAFNNFQLKVIFIVLFF
jgi:hypothetical protein